MARTHDTRSPKDRDGILKRKETKTIDNLQNCIKSDETLCHRTADETRGLPLP